MTTFWKYHGAGNDFVLLDARRGPVDNDTELAVRICHRRFGVGADGILLLGTSDTAECAMRIVNSDGSVAEMCGNGIRCLVKHVLDAAPGRDELSVETGAGVLFCVANRGPDGAVDTVRVAMGAPILERERIPVVGAGRPVLEELTHPDGETFRFTAVSMGNPHAVIFCDDGAAVELARRYGPGIEGHALFPKRVNAAFVRAHGTRFEAAVYERGAGLTAACGTGACAIGVAAGLEERVPFGTPLTVALPGGDLTIEVPPALDDVYMTGPARLVFTGELDEAALAPLDACLALTSALDL